MRGDVVEVVVDAGDGGLREYRIEARANGRRVESRVVRGILEVVEVTRNGEPVRTARFMQGRVVACVEHPAGDAREGE